MMEAVVVVVLRCFDFLFAVLRVDKLMTVK